MQKLFLTFFYSGLSPKAPGTAGSIVATLLGVLIIWYISMETLVLLTILLTILGVKAIDAYEKTSGTHDDKSIVIDEVVGVWIALILSSGSITQIIASFAFFRLFDIWKPSLIGRIDKNIHNGWGVIGDDILAGICAGICSAGVFQLLSSALN